MSDSDLPDLVESSDDDSGDNEQAQKGLVYADTWLKKGEKYLEKQELWMRVFSLAPFLFGVNNIISVAWNKALLNAKLLLTEKRNYETTFLEWQEWECLDLVDHVVTEVQSYFRNRNHLAKSLDCAGRLDECKEGVVIDVDLALNEAHKVTEISDLWRSILKHEVSSGKEKAAKFAVLYVIRIYREHVIFLCDKSQDFIEHTKKNHMRSNISGQKIAEEHKKKGNEYFKNENFDDAVHYYSLAAKEDPFSHVYYGNRAQAFLSLKKYRDALADGRRAIIIKPDFPKGHYRYAVAFHGLGQLDSAIRVNERGLELCLKSSTQDNQNIKELESQGHNLYQERADRNKSSVLTSIPKELDDKLASIPSPRTDITEKLGCTVPIKSRNDEPQCRGSSETDSDTPSTHDHKKVRRKKKSKAKSSTTKDTSSKTEKVKEKSEDMVIPQEKRNGQSDAKSEQQQQLEEFKTYLSDASDSFMRQANKNAMTSYQKALELVASSSNQKDFGMDDSDMLTLKYAFSISAIGTNNYKNIMDGIEKLEEIKDYCETHDDIKFPVLYYGLGKAYVSLNRFPEAIDPLQDGYQVASSVTYPQVTWPGTKQLIKETDPIVLQESLKNLLQLCKFPPPPDSVCRNHTDTTDKRTVIYLTDPDFKGYIKIICQMNCVITFHQVCFKSYKNSLNKQSDKDVLDTLCPTPDCVGYIMKVHVVRSDSLSKEYHSEKYVDFKENNKNKKPVAKQKTTNESKIAKKQDKKDKRKQKKKEHTDQELYTNNKQKLDDSDEVITDGASAMAFIADIENEVQALPDVKDTTVLRKDAIDVQKPGKSRKSKKKTKDKSKQILNVEVNFSDRREETLLNENSVLSDEEKENMNKPEPIQNPFSVPTELKSQITNFEKTYTGPPKTALLSKPDEVTENLFLYFVEILKANGPLAIDDTRIQQELEVFPQEALEKIKLVGGLADFLRQSLKFAVIDDVISLMSDAVRAREIALIRRQERQNSGNEPAVQNAWKTVGKSVNNVDALSESLKTNVTMAASISTSSSLNFSDVNSSVNSKTLSVLPNSNNSNSVSPFVDLPASTSQNNQGMHWSEGVSSFDITNPIKPPVTVPAPVQVSTFDTLDSIDDLPIQDTSELKTKKDLDDIDDLDGLSESGSELKESQENGGYKNGLRLDPRLASLDIGKVDSNSRCSSKSDISERSYGSAFGNIGQPKMPQMWDKLESDFDSSWSRGSREENQNVERNSVESVALEAKRLGEEFVRKSDETFVSELAESVVDKLYEGRRVSDSERTSTLNKVSADIWKDFERSANAGKKGVSSLWANTPAGADYSKNMGKFATDFMKRHYNSERNLVSPTSDLSTLPPQKPSVTPDSFSSFSNHPGFNSTFPWPDGKASKEMQIQPSVSSNSGYNLFSGPTWGLDSFNSSSAPSAPAPLSVPPPKPMMPPPQGPFVRPPLAVSGYYQHPNMQVPFRPPPRLPMPPPMAMPFPPQVRVEMKDKETQAILQVESIGTMTEVYEPFKKEYLQMKENRDEAIRVMAESKSLYEKLLLEHKAKEQQILVLEADINNKVGMFDLEKKSWKNDREAFVEEIKRLQEQVVTRDSQEKELKEKMIGQEKRVNELAILAKDQRDKDLAEIKKCMENAEKYRHLHDTQLQRAVSAESEILKSKLQAAKSTLERSQKEASFHKQRLSGFVQKHEEDNKPIPPPLQQAFEFMTSAVKKSEENLNSITVAYEEQIAKLKAGTPLADLEQIAVPSPPPVPESIRGLPFMQPGMPGFMMPRMQFPNRPPFNNPGMVKVPSPVGAAPAAIGAPVSAVPSKPTETVQQPVQAQVQSSIGNNNGLVATATQNHYNTSVPASVQGTPRPLVTPSAGGGLSKPGQLPPRAPLAVPNRAPLRPIGIGGLAAQMSSFDKLVVKLKMTFPEKSRAELSQLIHALRQKRGGSLSGMTMEDIIQQIAELITAQEQQAITGTLEQSSIQQAGSKAVGPPPGLNSSWAFLTAGGSKLGSGKGLGSELYREEEEDPCVICHEEMDPKSIVTLECGHLFHDECIRKWFQEQSTCPNCRVHTLLSDEFPSLG
ncbi:E3 ubiquitin-protein ligase TTC3-like [Mercenaria mercenaria]|uniref:E3 ubiquitin-protein ligase TTC3-like n=1 Tax=Mercenaria mercenaria TaxID=6596 RepID=UPI00234EA1AD|nr:E3 ubiquitin-protein ligase TTC3-like [Mercenaria mercenaria]